MALVSAATPVLRIELFPLLIDLMVFQEEFFAGVLANVRV